PRLRLHDGDRTIADDHRDLAVGEGTDDLLEDRAAIEGIADQTLVQAVELIALAGGEHDHPHRSSLRFLVVRRVLAGGPFFVVPGPLRAPLGARPRPSCARAPSSSASGSDSSGMGVANRCFTVLYG